MKCSKSPWHSNVFKGIFTNDAGEKIVMVQCRYCDYITNVDIKTRVISAEGLSRRAVTPLP